ncbi:hypothetical protein [uncultured Acetatifactor sp.]|uniref:hypothetical protein n=1 Tax=uncultured Acetatifactor sp. TaxID=1671927 RepID=UPI00263303C6|nr:hypothetical protein [uncultured Acetatifactor sp.]MCI8695477.1 hypothetical protein [Lachnospiraceae bacterium]
MKNTEEKPGGQSSLGALAAPQKSPEKWAAKHLQKKLKKFEKNTCIFQKGVVLYTSTEAMGSERQKSRGRG